MEQQSRALAVMVESVASPADLGNHSWHGVRAFVTGHTGFKGGWLSLWLTELGAEVAGYALVPDNTPSFYEAVGLSSLIKSEFADVREIGALKAALDRFRPDIVFHLAAQPLVRHSYKEPLETFAVNVMGTVNLLEAVRECPSVRGVVVVTTDKCYLNKETLWGYREHDPLGGGDPYSASKACAEIVARAYRRCYFSGDKTMLIATARAGNVIGGGDWGQDRLIPDIVRAFEQQSKVVLRYPLAVRPWQHVFEPLEGYLELGARLLHGEKSFADAFNFGPDNVSSVAVGVVAHRFASAMKPGLAVETDERGHPHESILLSLDSTKAHRLLGWRAPLNLDERIALAASWYRAYYEGKAMRSLSLSQIDWYQAKRLERRKDNLSFAHSVEH